MRKTFSDETFSSLKVKKKKNQIGLLVTKFFVTKTFSDMKIYFVVVYIYL